MISYLKEKRLQRKAQRLLTSGKYERAWKFFQEIILLNDSPENQFNLALALIALKRFQDASFYLEKVNQNYPENELAALTLAECYLRLKLWDKASEVYRVQLKFKPNNQSLLRYLQKSEDVVAREKYVRARDLADAAERSASQKQYQEAREKLEEALSYMPDDPNILNNLAACHWRQKDYEKAFFYLEKAFKLAPGDKKIQKNLVSVKRRLKN
ncbi:MAG: tetratricopeptide repeat protein [Candidatus Cloacimonetes bacterium]|nr:tetratricopeptide repeat protein [Candidatus Cloacimonadota bacterium]